MKNNTEKGFTLVEILIVVAIIGLLAAIAMPAIVGARKEAQTKQCQANLAKINTAIQSFRLLNANAMPGSLAALEPWARGINTLACPVGGAYGFNAGSASCSIATHMAGFGSRGGDAAS